MKETRRNYETYEIILLSFSLMRLNFDLQLGWKKALSRVSGLGFPHVEPQGGGTDEL